MKWEIWFDILKDYRKKYFYKWPKKSEIFQDKKIGLWCKQQRALRKKGILDKSKIRKLERIKFPWNSIEGRWRIQYNYLLRYRKRYSNDWPMDTEEFPNRNRLGLWCREQRDRYRQKTLKPEYAELLNEIGFPWNKKIYKKLNGSDTII